MPPNLLRPICPLGQYYPTLHAGWRQYDGKKGKPNCGDGWKLVRWDAHEKGLVLAGLYSLGAGRLQSFIHQVRSSGGRPDFSADARPVPQLQRPGHPPRPGGRVRLLFHSGQRPGFGRGCSPPGDRLGIQSLFPHFPAGKLGSGIRLFRGRQ
jgi:hypothetical protein